jgi:parallel beta-helix repeat protein
VDVFHQVLDGGNVRVNNNTVDGGRFQVFRIDDAGNIEVQNNTVKGSKFSDLDVSNNFITGNMAVRNNKVTGPTASLDVGYNNVDGSVVVDNNSAAQGGAVIVISNVVTNTLGCHNNKPAPIDFGFANTARKKTGECASL